MVWFGFNLKGFGKAFFQLCMYNLPWSCEQQQKSVAARGIPGMCMSYIPRTTPGWTITTQHTNTFRHPFVCINHAAPASFSSLANTRAHHQLLWSSPEGWAQPRATGLAHKGFNSQVSTTVQAVLNRNTIVENTPWQAWRWYKSRELLQKPNCSAGLY